MKYCLDANVLITSWVNYKIEFFPTLWEIFHRKRENFVLIKTIHEEIKENEKLVNWIDEKLSPVEKESDEIHQRALRLGKKYEREEDDMKDMILIAHAEAQEHTVITYEKRQYAVSSRHKKNYKIPLICEKEGVRCIDFFEMLRELKIQL